MHRAGFLARDGQRLVELAQHEPRVVVERKPVLGGRDAARGAVEQRLADLALELGELLAERGLRDEELPRRRGKAAAFDDLGEVAKLSQIHRSPPPRRLPETISKTYTPCRKTVFLAGPGAFLDCIRASSASATGVRYTPMARKKPVRRKTAFVEKMARIAWQEFPGHFGGALSKALVGPDNSGSSRIDFRISRYAPNAYVQEHVHKVQEQIYYVLEGEGILTVGKERAPDAAARLRLRAARRAPQLHQYRTVRARVPRGDDPGRRRRARVTDPREETRNDQRQRRTVLKAGAAGALALGFPAIVRSQSDKIKIGHLTPLTGFLGALGEYAVMGIKMAEEEINKAGGVMGRQLDVMSEDSVNPATAATKAQRMLERDGATVLMGEINSASALTIMQVAARNKRLFMQIGARSDVLRGKNCNRYTFHVDIPVTVMVNAVGQALLRDNTGQGQDASSCCRPTTSSATTSLKAAKAFIAGNGGNMIGDELVATDVTDFSAYMLKIRRAKPDVVCSNLAGNQVTNLVKQYAEFGLPFPIVGFNLNTADAWAAGEGNLSGIWPTVWMHDLDTPGSKAFTAAFTKKHGKPPENHAWIEYVSLKMMAQAMNETKSTDTEKLIAYFEKADGVRHPEGAQGVLPLLGPPADAGGLSRSPSSPRARRRTSGTSSCWARRSRGRTSRWSCSRRRKTQNTCVF